ncbi:MULTISPECIES: hypothetical protein [Streptomyces]|uniref:Uncharacterized protein n=1 Tax=Streptomyces changanensis TaxID=2964669 RepID=A0ABY5NC18_9ACTN|nr:MULTISPECIES: hypothetical protein [Streptomyces]UUS33592.1 hypothetical protein NRO40_24040 [Streptomyces changanensis]
MTVRARPRGSPVANHRNSDSPPPERRGPPPEFGDALDDRFASV